MSQFEKSSMRKVYHKGKESIYGLTPREEGESFYSLTPREEEGESFYGLTPREASESSYSSYSLTPQSSQSKIYSTNNPYQSFSEFKRERSAESEHYIPLRSLNLGPKDLSFTKEERYIISNFQRIIVSSIKFIEHDKKNLIKVTNNILFSIILNFGELRHSADFLNKIEYNLGQEAKICFESILNLSKKELQNEGKLREALSEMTCLKQEKPLFENKNNADILINILKKMNEYLTAAGFKEYTFSNGNKFSKFIDRNDTFIMFIVLASMVIILAIIIILIIFYFTGVLGNKNRKK